jgi:hypothetical protein
MKPLDLMLLGNRRQKQEEARKCVAEFVNSDSDDLVFVQNATTGKSYDLVLFENCKVRLLGFNLNSLIPIFVVLGQKIKEIPGYVNSWIYSYFHVFTPSLGSLNEHEIPVMSVIIENSFHLFITGVNSVLKSLKLEQGDIILCTDNSYNAVKKTCEAIAPFDFL